MKTATAALQTLLATPSAHLVTADLYTITLVTGQVFYITSLDADVVFNGVTYLHTDPIIERTAIKQKRLAQDIGGVKVDAVTITIQSTSANLVALGLTLKQAIVAGLFDGATIRIDRIFNPVRINSGTAYSVDATPYGSVVVFVGYVADADVDSVKAEITCSPALDFLAQPYPRDVFQAACPFFTYSASCGLTESNFTVTDIAAGRGSTQSAIVIPKFNLPAGIPKGGTPMPDGWLDQGKVVFTSGKNQGLVRSIVTSIGAGNQRFYKQAIINDSPLAYWTLGDAVGASTAADSSGNFYGAAVNGGVTFGQVGPLVGDTTTAALFDGGTGYLSISVVPNPQKTANYGAALTVEFWCKPLVATFQGIFDSNPSGLSSNGAPGSALRNTIPAGSGLSFSAMQWTPNKPGVGFACTPNQWSHVVAIWRGGRYVDVYVNGLYSAGGSAAGGDTFIWQGATIGRATAGSGGYSNTNFNVWFDGYLAQVAIYNYALSQDQVATHYRIGTNNPSTSTQGLITLFSALPFAPASGDLMSLTAGDDHMMTTCQRKFNNAANFGGFPFVPSNETAF